MSYSSLLIFNSSILHCSSPSSPSMLSYSSTLPKTTLSQFSSDYCLLSIIFSFSPNYSSIFPIWFHDGPQLFIPFVSLATTIWSWFCMLTSLRISSPCRSYPAYQMSGVQPNFCLRIILRSLALKF